MRRKGVGCCRADGKRAGGGEGGRRGVMGHTPWARSNPVPFTENDSRTLAFPCLAVLIGFKVSVIVVAPRKRDDARGTVPRHPLVRGQTRDKAAVATPSQMAAKVGGIICSAIMGAYDTLMLHFVLDISALINGGHL